MFYVKTNVLSLEISCSSS